jgi:hypothetical protein
LILLWSGPILIQHLSFFFQHRESIPLVNGRKKLTVQKIFFFYFLNGSRSYAESFLSQPLVMFILFRLLFSVSLHWWFTIVLYDITKCEVWTLHPINASGNNFTQLWTVTHLTSVY